MEQERFNLHFYDVLLVISFAKTRFYKMQGENLLFLYEKCQFFVVVQLKAGINNFLYDINKIFQFS